ncbi:alginate export family protein [Aquimarina litoralis]|uniref:Alginate export family protein n=1 Tax=Aquimarina litoralis TaxID=584605 RepID=A0ABP3UCV9_9FLAO
MKNKLFFTILLTVMVFKGEAQELSVDAMVRPRFEYRHGFQDVAPEDVEGSAFVSQRSALLVKYSDSKITTFLDLQGTSVWGDRPQLSTADDQGNGGFRVNRAWALLSLGGGWSTKVGRQFLSYDDQRILGALGWADQQRTHDAALIRYKNSSLKLDVGFAFNQNGISNFGNVFQPSGAGQPVFQYKSLQFLHLNNKFSESFSGSFLFLNNQFQALDGTGAAIDRFISRHTTGVYSKYKKGAFGLDGSFYYQFGDFTETVSIGAYQAMLNLTYKPGKTLFGIGAEILSGNDPDTADKTEAFFPLFGTNHKFNGFQDFFYVGRHANNGGLLDLNVKAVFKLGEKSTLLTKAHYFSGLEDAAFNGTPYEASSYGTSVDLVFTQKITSYAKLNIGYSQSFLNDDFANARAGGEADSIQNWGWVMLTVNPNLFKWNKSKE